jgi:diadenosine tetraphosphate (Ap4A) HIT family hydrolase
VPPDLNDPCLECEIAAGRVRPPGGIVWRDGAFVVHGLAGPSPVAGYLVVGSARHARGLYDLDAAEASALGPLLVRLQRAQRTTLAAEHAYLFVVGDVLRHFHAHVVPRYADTPERLRGARVLQATPGDARPLEEIEAACAALAKTLSTPPLADRR